MKTKDAMEKVETKSANNNGGATSAGYKIYAIKSVHVAMSSAQQTTAKNFLQHEGGSSRNLRTNGSGEAQLPVPFHHVLRLSTVWNWAQVSSMMCHEPQTNMIDNPMIMNHANPITTESSLFLAGSNRNGGSNPVAERRNELEELEDMV